MNLRDSLKLIKLIDKKELIFIGFLQFIYASIEIFFSGFAGYTLSRVISKKGDDLFGLALNLKEVLLILGFFILIRFVIGLLITKITANSIFRIWDKVVTYGFKLIRNGVVNLDSINKFSHQIQYDTSNAIPGYYFNFYLLVADLLILIIGMLILAYINLPALIYILITAILFWFIFAKPISKSLYKFGDINKKTILEIINQFRFLIAFRDIKWLRNAEKEYLENIKINSKRLIKNSTSHFVYLKFNYISIETFSVVILITFPIFSSFINGVPLSEREFLITLAISSKLLLTFNKATNEFQNLVFHIPLAKDLVKRIYSRENLKKYQNLDSFNNIRFPKRNKTSKNKESILFVKGHVNNTLKGSKYLFPDIEILKSNKYLLVGPSGCGKSSLIKNILELPSRRYKNKYEYYLNCEKVSYISTEHEIDFSRIKSIFDFGIKTNQREKIVDLLALLELSPRVRNIENLKNADLSRFSSGQKMRLRFITELIFNPELLIIDESFSSLDSKILKKCIKYVDIFNKEISLLVIDHSNNLKDLNTFSIKQI